MSETILAVFDNQHNAEGAINDLLENGYQTKDFSIITRDTITSTPPTTTDHVADGAVSGAATGGALGALAGLLVGIGAITLPGIGAVLIGGPIAAALGLTGAAAVTATGAMTGAVAGGLVGALSGLGVSEETAELYEQRIVQGGVLIAVALQPNKETNARTILEQHGAEQVTMITR